MSKKYIDIRVEFEENLVDDDGESYTDYNPTFVRELDSNLDGDARAAIGESVFQMDKYTSGVTYSVLSVLSTDQRTSFPVQH